MIKSKLKYFLQAIAVLCIVIFFIYTAKYVIPNMKKEVAQPIAKQTGAVTRSIDQKWNQYTNYDLGFSINIPKETYRVIDYKTMKAVAVPLVAIEDASAKVVYITDAWMIDKNGEKLKDTSLDDLQKISPINWKISLADASSEADVLAFIKKTYYSGCGIEEIEESNVKGIYDVSPTFTTPDAPDEGYCFINWGTVNKYSPSKKKIAYWNLGQDANFLDINTNPFDDKEIANSFRFLEL